MKNKKMKIGFRDVQTVLHSHICKYWCGNIDDYYKILLKIFRKNLENDRKYR